jgi:hypothetical protein
VNLEAEGLLPHPSLVPGTSATPPSASALARALHFLPRVRPNRSGQYLLPHGAAGLVQSSCIT